MGVRLGGCRVCTPYNGWVGVGVGWGGRWGFGWGGVGSAHFKWLDGIGWGGVADGVSAGGV